MKLVYIKEEYTDYLRAVDERIPHNREKDYRRPYVGVVFSMKENLYFVPLTTSYKFKKLWDYPREKSMTFIPLGDKCKWGGLNINNMMPVVEGAYKTANYTIASADTKQERDRKFLLLKQKIFIDSIEKEIRRTALNLYNQKNQGKLEKDFPWYDSATCDFKKLEIAAAKYQPSKKKK